MAGAEKLKLQPRLGVPPALPPPSQTRAARPPAVGRCPGLNVAQKPPAAGAQPGSESSNDLAPGTFESPGGRRSTLDTHCGREPWSAECQFGAQGATVRVRAEMAFGAPVPGKGDALEPSGFTVILGSAAAPKRRAKVAGQ